MVQQITKGIKISVNTVYNGAIYRNQRLYHAFSYFISIENKSRDVVQLTDRYWTIIDTLNDTEYVAGEGVVGQTPVLSPGEEYNYKSNCFLTGASGAMTGKYKMVNRETDDEFYVAVPTFQLSATSMLN